jgi:uncharacterized protein YcaQ
MADSITLAHARRLALRAQGLDNGWSPGRGVDGAAAVVERLGYVQIDTIAVIERAHEHVFWTRQPSYRPAYLHRLMQQRRVFEYWTHAASYVPMTDYRYYVARMRWHASGGRRWEGLRERRKVADHVLERIREEGPLTAADFADTRGRRGPWWDWKPAKAALEALFDCGQLMIAERRNFQRVYDLAERLLPEGVDTEPPPADERARWAVHRTLDNLGIADSRQVRQWHRDDAQREVALGDLLDAREIVEVQIRGDDGSTLYARPADLQATAKGRATTRVHLLSPFDNMIIRRPWVRRLFDFDYTIECYVPAAKRRYGYFCLPVLAGDRLVARLDPKAERDSGTLRVRRLEFEPGVDVAPLLPRLAESIRRFATFNGCDAVRVDKVVPAAVRAPLRAAIEAA